MWERILILVGIMLATAFLGEMKMNPFGETFRFSLGIAAYFFGMLWFRSVSLLVTGFFVGSFICVFRITTDCVLHGLPPSVSFYAHFPATFYYFIFALILHVTRLRESSERPLRVVVIGAVADITSNLAELFVRHLAGETYSLSYDSFLFLFLFGSLRSIFVVGLYNIFSNRQVRALGEARQRELERLLVINADLYEEAFYLRKSMTHLEEITQKSYQLYKKLIGRNSSAPKAIDIQQQESLLPTLALQIAESVHEVKKDSQRILAGLSKIITQEDIAPRLTIRDLCELVVRANKKYAELLSKQVSFSLSCDVNLSTNQVYALLSVLNNIVSNAVEAIPFTGTIELDIDLSGEEIVFHILDSGEGVPAEDREWVFEMGYTTKYDTSGTPSTGIGLSHARDIVRSLHGSIRIVPDEVRTHFEVLIPTDQLIRREDI